MEAGAKETATRSKGEIEVVHTLREGARAEFQMSAEDRSQERTVCALRENVTTARTLHSREVPSLSRKILRGHLRAVLAHSPIIIF